MTDKQIIIDGVDVKDCYYYNNGKCLGCYALNKKNCISTYGICKEIDDCHCKQLKRKEQECEELKETLKVIANRPCLNINDCNGNCLPHCKRNAHKLAQEALKELE